MAFRPIPSPTRPGWVYVLTNPAMPGLVKIGHTSRAPEVRAGELSASTGVAARFVVAWSHQVTDHEALEGIVHGRLAACRANDNREFFRCSVPHARRIIEKEAAALLLPWWRAWLRRLVHPLPASARPAWRSAPAWRRSRGDRSGSVIMLAGAAIAAIVAFRPGWLPPGLVHLLVRLPHF